MKRSLLSILSLLTVALAAVAQPRISSNKETHNFGQIEWKRPVTVEYTITNTGNQPLVLTNVTTSCACAVADWTKEPIAPGGKGVVKASFDAKALGHFEKSIGIYSNASPSLVYLKFTGEVVQEIKDYTKLLPYTIGNIRLDRDEFAFPDVNRGQQPSLTFDIANLSDRPYEPVLMHLPPYLSAVATPDKLGRNRTGKIKVTLDTEKLPKLGLTTASVYLSRFPGDKVGEENEIPVSAVLLPDFSRISQQERLNPPAIHLSAKELVMGELADDEKRSQTIIVKNVGKSNLEIRDLQVFNSALGVQLKKRVLKPGATTKMKITAYGHNLRRVKGSPRVLMITNDPNSPKIIINVKVTSKK